MKQRKIGTLSMGFLLIMLGLILLGKTFLDISIVKILIYSWPIILILLGLEIILYSFSKKDSPIRFDILSIVILIIALIFTSAFYSVQTNGLYKLFPYGINNNSYNFDINEHLELSDTIEQVIIEAPNGEFNIIGANSNTANIIGTINIEANNKSEAEKYFNELFTIETIGNQAIIKVKQLENFNWLKGGTTNAQLDIHIPNDKYLKSNLINGDTYIYTMYNSGNINGTNGKIELQNTKGDYYLTTVNGKIKINNNDGSINAKTVNGEIDIESQILNGDWDISNVNGEIDINLPYTADAKIIGKTSFGDVKGNLQWVNKDSNDKLGSNKEAILNSGKYLIDMKTTNGDIEVDLK